MRILRSNRHKNCADGSFMKEFVLSTEVTPDFLDFLPILELSKCYLA